MLNAIGWNEILPPLAAQGNGSFSLWKNLIYEPWRSSPQTENKIKNQPMSTCLVVRLHRKTLSGFVWVPDLVLLIKRAIRVLGESIYCATQPAHISPLRNKCCCLLCTSWSTCLHKPGRVQSWTRTKKGGKWVFQAVRNNLGVSLWTRVWIEYLGEKQFHSGSVSRQWPEALTRATGSETRRGFKNCRIFL